MARTRTACAPSWVAAALLGLTASAPAQEPPRPEEVAGLVQQLSSGDDAARREAYERLARLGAARKGELRAHLEHDDPQVRFHVFSLLSEADAAVEQRVRAIVEGRADYCALYPEALAARAEAFVLPEADVAERLVRLVRRRADGSSRGERYATTALDLLADRLRFDAARGQPASVELAGAIAGLCDLDLRAGFDDLATALAALPPERGHAALRSVITSGAPIAQARAARVLAEIATKEHAPAAARAINALLSHARPEVRIAALRSLDILPLSDQDLVPAGALAQDKDPAVAEVALRIAGQRRLAFAREAAERAAAAVPDPGEEPPVRAARQRLRREAVRTLGLLGVPGSADVLRPLLASDDAELIVLAAWALGGVRAEDAREQLLGLLARPDITDERLYNGLARLGPEGVQTLRELIAEPGVGVPRVPMIAALGLARPEGAVPVLLEVVRRPMQRGGEGESDVAAAVQAICDQRSDEARTALATLLVDGLGPWQSRTLDTLVPLVGDIGPPPDPALRARLTQSLERLVLGSSLRDVAAMSLVFIDRQKAREAIQRVLGLQGGGGTAALLHALARAGETTPARTWAVVQKRAERDRAQQDARFNTQNEYGIELLYADLLVDADLEFRRMLWCKPTDDTAAYNVACGHALGGRVEEGLRALRRAIRNGFDKADHMAADTDLKVLRDDARFQRILQGMFLEEETGLRAPKDAWPSEAAARRGQPRGQ